ncbi:MAG TPA: YciI family protein [Sphingobium sp.]
MEKQTDETVRTAALQQIRSKMIQKDYYLMHRRPLDAARKAAVVLEHFEWLVSCEKNGSILITGALFDRDGKQLDGLTVIRANSWEEAEAIAATDPFVANGGVEFEIQRWRLGAGRITLSFDLSCQTAAIS